MKVSDSPKQGVEARWTRGRLTHLLFDISVIAKGIDGVLQVAGGILLFVVSPDRLHWLARRASPPRAVPFPSPATSPTTQLNQGRQDHRI
jgi:hypothetical protein